MLSPTTEDYTHLLAEKAWDKEGLSHTLFIVFMDKIINKSKQCTRGFCVRYKYLQRVEVSECDFADDVIIMAEKKEYLKESLERYKEILESYGIRINKGKVKVMAIEVIPEFEGENIQLIHKYKYLGVTVEDREGKW